MLLSIIIPVYNETKRIGLTLKRIIDFMKDKGYIYEIIVVDDGSVDGTPDLVSKKFAAFGAVKVLRNELNHGKGYVVRQGMLDARGDVLFYTDADLASPIQDMEKMLFLINSGYDVVVGSRVIKDSEAKVKRVFWRYIIGRIFNFLVRVIAVGGVTDTQCGFKMFTRGAAKKIFSRQKIHTYTFDVEIMYLAKRLGLKVKEVPVSWSEVKDTKVKFVRDSLMMFRDLVRIRILHRGKDEFVAKE